MKTAVTGTVKVLLLVASITTLLVLPAFTDPVNLPKFVVLIGLSFGLILYTGSYRKSIFSAGSLIILIKKVFREPVQIALLLFIFGLFISMMFSMSPLSGFLGLSGRRNGFLTYFALFLLFIVAKSVGTVFALNWFLRFLAISGGLQAVYMLLQFTGLDPISWTGVHENKMFGTFGNPNFSSAFLAVALPAMIFCTTSKGILKRIRYRYGLASLAAILALALSGVYQGLISMVASFAVVITLYFHKFSKSRTKKFSTPIFATASLASVFGIFQLGPLAGIFSKGTFELRAQAYWPIAREMGQQNLFFGVGSEQFVNYFPRYYSPSLRERFGQITADNAHNYLFHFFAEGGLIVVLPYLSYLILFSLLVMSFTLKSSKSDSYIYLAILGVWVAYLGQMLVSIDTIGISVWIWIMSGLLLGVKLNQDPLASNQSYLEKSTQSIKGQKTNKKFSFRSVLSLTAAAVTIFLLSPLGILDNKVWQLENALKSNNTVPVTREELDSLYKSASNWSLDPTLLSRSSSILLSYGFQDKGFELLNRATLMNQDSPTLWNLRAAATESILNRQLAAPIRERELELDPWNQESSIQYIKDLIESRRFESAKKEFRRLEKFSPKSTVPSELKNYFEKEGN
jgi:hypothetical protein